MARDRRENPSPIPEAEFVCMIPACRMVIRRLPPFIKSEVAGWKKMGLKTIRTSRKRRSDSVRNRERLLEAATKIFSVGGPQASLEAIARETGLGIGTLYRHFPTREALFEAVYRQEVDHLAELAEELSCDK